MSLVPVLVLAAVLGASFRTEARRRGLAEARSEATLLAHAAVEPLLEGHPLQHDVNAGLSTLYRSLALGLGALYIVLFVIAASVSKGLRRESARNAFLAEHDALTELPNRSLFRRRVEAAVNDAVRNGRATA